MTIYKRVDLKKDQNFNLKKMLPTLHMFSIHWKKYIDIDSITD